MLSPRLVLLAGPVQQAGRGPDPPEEPSVLESDTPNSGPALVPEARGLPAPKGPLSSGYSLGPWSSSGLLGLGIRQAGALQAGGTETHKPAAGSTRPAAPLIAGARVHGRSPRVGAELQRAPGPGGDPDADCTTTQGL